ncbi:MAG: OST-HTH/LOTUS domain-containing protein [Methylococcaceae bacterium]
MKESHIDKLKLMLKRGIEEKELADMLGISPRTLSEFLRPGGRTPTGALEKLIDTLTNDSSSTKARACLSFIHKDFSQSERTQEKPYIQIVVNQIKETFGDSTFDAHFITTATASENVDNNDWALEDALKLMGVTSYFLKYLKYADKPANEKPYIQILDIFFSSTVISVIHKNLYRNIGEIILAADVNKFWPLAAEIKSISGISPKFLSKDSTQNILSIASYLKDIGTDIIPITVRYKGVVRYKHEDYCFIEYKDKGHSEQIFCSWKEFKTENDYNKRRVDFEELEIEDEVYFSIGSNKQGICAIDALRGKSTTKTQTKVEKIPIDQIKEAWEYCKNADGWANLADVGSRLTNIILPAKSFSPTNYGYQKLRPLIEATGKYEIESNYAFPPVYSIRLKTPVK